PVAVGRATGEPGLDRSVLLERTAVLVARVGIDAEHLAGSESPAPHAAAPGDGNCSGLGAAHDQAVLGALPAEGTQPIAVERGADATAIAEDHACGPVPGLREACVVPEVVDDVRIQITHPFPSFGDEHRHR